jgi:hypothetical protein
MRDLEQRIQEAANLAEVKAAMCDMRAILEAEIEAGMW